MGFYTGMSEDDVEEIRREYEVEIGGLEKELATLRAELAKANEENDRLLERLLAAEYVLKQARPESGYWDTYAKEALG